MLTYYERKARLPMRASKLIREVTKRSSGYISLVLAGKRRNRQIEEMFAAVMRDPVTNRTVSVTEAFGPADK